ncbi:relaxase/mobilization nuclease domain-containing protein [Chamaesiphon minutus]|uniref:Relaxase/mobilization nuclease n=1 Tax=Chamaesiphon minutus (strain ATCC 27169 / PCC 6605) TaxID=1173020 RepID=K9UD46_CHAP6|nr:relaxase/mobilization nuclease domain-containing protein [Chamaesiphon minutus]AFY92740.1 relaxase/mobilization nuclease [Chamaesiphon minutus PCC 6605]
MISRTTHGSNFKGLLDYLLNPEKRPEIIANYMFGNNPTDLAREFNEVASLRPTTKLPVRHISLSFAPGDVVDRLDRESIVNRVMTHMGYDDCQFIGIAHHRDDPGHDLPHDHDHLHIVVNAVDVYGRRVSDSWDRFKIQPILRGIERDFGLQPVKNSWEVKQEKVHKLNPDLEIFQLVDRSLENCPNLETWIDRLQESQIDVLFALRQDNQVNGITYLQGSRAYKGSEIGVSWNAVARQVPTTPDNLPLIRAANDKSQEHRMDLGEIERQNFDRAVMMANMVVKGRERIKTGRLDIKRDGDTLTAYRMRPHRQIFKAIETLGGWEPVGFPNIERIDLNLLTKLSGYKDAPAYILEEQDLTIVRVADEIALREPQRAFHQRRIDSEGTSELCASRQAAFPLGNRSSELPHSSSIPVTLKQIIDLKNYYVNSPEGRAKPEGSDALEKFDIYKLQLSQHGKAATGDPNLKMTNKFFKTFESDRIKLCAADRANLDAASAFATEQAQIALEIAQASSLELRQRSRGCSR